MPMPVTASGGTTPYSYLWNQGTLTATAGSLAAGSHLTKAGTRALANQSPEPLSNWSLSLGEDALVGGGLVLAFLNPWLFLALLGLLILLALWLLPRLWRALRGLLAKLKRQAA